jgi:protein-S-isoprenylcysteine O-methyltransferase Ste14
MSPTLRTFLYAVVILGVLLGYLPWQLLRLDVTIGKFLQAFLLYASLGFFLAGAVLLFSGTYYLVLRGEGTPLPFDPPKRMVVAGPYSHMQHPMMLGLLLIVFAEAVLLR